MWKLEVERKYTNKTGYGLVPLFCNYAYLNIPPTYTLTFIRIYFLRILRVIFAKFYLEYLKNKPEA